MKIFLSYRFTGEDIKKLEIIIKNICSKLEEAGYTCYCSLWDENFFQKNKYNNTQILKHALNKLDDSDIYFAFINSNEKSEGILIEAGYAFAKKKKIYSAIRKGVKTTFMKELSDKNIEFSSLSELNKKLKQLKQLK